MRKKRQFQKIQIVVIIIIALVVGVQAYLRLPDRVGHDFVQFNNAVLTPALSLAPYTTRISLAKTDSEKANAYSIDYVPVYAEKVRLLQNPKSYQPKTDEVRRLRGEYLTGFQELLQGYLDFTQAVQLKDAGKNSSSDQHLANGRAALSRAQQDGLKLFKAHHLQFDSRKKK